MKLQQQESKEILNDKMQNMNQNFSFRPDAQLIQPK